MAGCRLVLASASPRRQELVRLLDLPWRVAPQDVDEDLHLLGNPLVSALSVAAAKSRAVAPELKGDEVAVCADTIVVSDGRILNKPGTPDEARAMLGDLRARPHRVMTGVALRVANGQEWGATVSTRVVMRGYSNREIEDYVARGEPFDKAGGYAVQDRAFHPVERLEGCYLNVVGLPLCAVTRGLETLGRAPASLPPAPLVPPCSYCHAGEALVKIERT